MTNLCPPWHLKTFSVNRDPQEIIALRQPSRCGVGFTLQRPLLLHNAWWWHLWFMATVFSPQYLQLSWHIHTQAWSQHRYTLINWIFSIIPELSRFKQCLSKCQWSYKTTTIENIFLISGLTYLCFANLLFGNWLIFCVHNLTIYTTFDFS